VEYFQNWPVRAGCSAVTATLSTTVKIGEKLSGNSAVFKTALIQSVYGNYELLNFLIRKVCLLLNDSQKSGSEVGITFVRINGETQDDGNAS